ncbi:MAG TPA: phosphatidate cytidylyltransferase [Candidatus Dormibacteraeota bacterium]|nr:phosphatidate cytidylyltransferase [Candidatus Dormibacteraeota bacterium]
MTWKRVATAVVLIPLVVGLVRWGPTAVLSLVLALVIVLALFEYFSLGDAIGHRGYRFWTATCALILVYVTWLSAMESRWKEVGEGAGRLQNIEHWFGRLPSIADVFFVFVLGVAALTVWSKRPLVEALPAAGMSSSGLLLIAFPLTYGLKLHAQGQYGPWLLMFALVITWVGDSVAYFVGRATGRFPLAPQISPKKTWEGSISGFLGSLAAGAAFIYVLPLSLAQLLGMAAAGSIVGQVGDLLESAYKRSAGVKDSGGLLPGHGGILDRIDALILTFPVVWYYWECIWHSASGIP